MAKTVKKSAKTAKKSTPTKKVSAVKAKKPVAEVKAKAKPASSKKVALVKRAIKIPVKNTKTAPQAPIATRSVKDKKMTKTKEKTGKYE